jgi:hypothetical protein
MGAVLSPLIELFAVEKARLWRGLSRSIIGAAIALLAVVAALEGLMVILIGSYASLILTREPWEAGLIIGGGLILLALLVLGITAAVLRRGGGRIPEPSFGAGQVHGLHESRAGVSSPSLVQAAASEIMGRANIKVRDVALVALVAGMALGVSPGLRRRLLGGKAER